MQENPIEHEIHSLEEQVYYLRQEQSKMQQALYSLEGTIIEIEKYKKLDNKECDSMVLLGNGVFIKGRLKKQDTVYMDIGGIVSEKTIADALKTLDERQARITKNMGEIEKGIGALQRRYTELLKKNQKREK